MKLSLDSGPGIVVTATGEGWIRVGTAEVRENAVLTRDEVVTPWAAAGSTRPGSASKRWRPALLAARSTS